MINFKDLPNKLFEICDFKKSINGGCVMYSYDARPELRDVIIVNEQPNFEIPHDFKVVSKAIEVSNKLNDETINIDVQNNNFLVKSKKGSYKVNLLGTDNFTPPNEIYLKTLKTDIKKLANACEYVAVKSDRPILRGVRIDFNGNIYASDKFRIYIHQVADFCDEGITIPATFIKIVKDNFGDIDDVELHLSEHKVKATKGNISIIGNIYEGQFPNLTKIVSSTSNKLNVIDKNIVGEALDYLKYMVNDSKDKSNYVVLKDGKLTLKGQSTFETEFDLGLQYDESICVDANYLTKAIATFEASKLKCMCSDGNVKTLFKLTDEIETVILMCIRTD